MSYRTLVIRINHGLLTFCVASFIRSILRLSFRNSWWLADELVNISTPSKPIAMCGLPFELCIMSPCRRSRHTSSA